MSDKRIFNEQVIAGFDLNTLNNVTAAFSLQAYKTVSYQVDVDSGAFGSTVLTLQLSNDGVTWHDTASTLAAEGLLDVGNVPAKMARLRVSTAAGVAGTAKVSAIAKA